MAKDDKAPGREGGGWRWGYLLAALFGAALLLNLMVGRRLVDAGARASDEAERFRIDHTFQSSVDYIRRYYVEPSRARYRDLYYRALDGMLQSLDAHSQFLDPEELKALQEDTSGQFGGIGVVVGTRSNRLTIVSAMEGSPGFKAGLMAGDILLSVDGERIDGVLLSDAVKRMRGSPGTKVVVKVERPPAGDIKAFEVTRAEVLVPSVKDVRLVSGDIGYVRVTEFREPTGRDLWKALESLREQGAKALVLDLRNNPGGLLTSALEVSQMFLPANALIVYTQGRSEKERQYHHSMGARRILDWPLAVLVNGGSASASEIFAGAVQDHRRGVLVGEKTFGKGSVQTVITMEDGSALRLTTARYFTPNHSMIHEAGIEPDIVMPVAGGLWEDILQLRSSAENGGGATATAEADRLDGPLQRAVDVLHDVRTFHGMGK